MLFSGPELTFVFLFEQVALKDVVWLNKNEEVNIIARYAPWDGLYMVSYGFDYHHHRQLLTRHSSIVIISFTKIT